MCLGTYPYIYMLSVFWGFWFCGCGLFVGGLWVVLWWGFLFLYIFGLVGGVWCLVGVFLGVVALGNPSKH